MHLGDLHYSCAAHRTLTPWVAVFSARCGRSIQNHPGHPLQWLGLVICLQEEDQFAVNICDNFGLSLAGGVHGTLGDDGTDTLRGNGIGPLSKWVDDHVFSRTPHQHFAAYNISCAQWSQEIHEVYR